MAAIITVMIEGNMANDVRYWNELITQLGGLECVPGGVLGVLYRFELQSAGRPWLRPRIIKIKAFNYLKQERLVVQVCWHLPVADILMHASPRFNR
jgi:hypothetical protein